MKAKNKARVLECFDKCEKRFEFAQARSTEWSAGLIIWYIGIPDERKIYRDDFDKEIRLATEVLRAEELAADAAKLEYELEQLPANPGNGLPKPSIPLFQPSGFLDAIAGIRADLLGLSDFTVLIERKISECAQAVSEFAAYVKTNDPGQDWSHKYLTDPGPGGKIEQLIRLLANSDFDDTGICHFWAGAFQDRMAETVRLCDAVTAQDGLPSRALKNQLRLQLSILTQDLDFAQNLDEDGQGLIVPLRRMAQLMGKTLQANGPKVDDGAAGDDDTYTDARWLRDWEKVFDANADTIGIWFRNGKVKARKMGKRWQVAVSAIPKKSINEKPPV